MFKTKNLIIIEITFGLTKFEIVTQHLTEINIRWKGVNKLLKCYATNMTLK